jgi:NhaP-type Na+/H+ or K+/H+ antiporter
MVRCGYTLQGANAAEAVWLVLVLTALLAAARAAFVVPFSLLHNIWSADKLSSRDIVVVWWAGGRMVLLMVVKPCSC